MTINNMTLVKIAALGGFATVSMGYAFQRKINNNIKDTVYYKEALRELRSNKGAVYLLGEPIKDKLLDLKDTTTKNYTKDDCAFYEVPVKGPKQRGILYFWANKKEDTWKVEKIELSVDNQPDRRLIIKNKIN